MHTFMKQRATETGDISYKTPAIDVEGMPLLVFELIVYNFVGSSPSLLCQLQTSNDLDTWSDVTGSSVTLTTAGEDRDTARAADRPYGRYVRFSIAVTGTTTELEYSLVLNTYRSS